MDKLNSVHFVQANFLEATEQFLAIQIPLAWNNQYKHLNDFSAEVFKKFPYANSYEFPEILTIRPMIIRDAIINSGHKSHELHKQIFMKEGMIDIRGNGTNQRYIANMFTRQFTDEMLKHQDNLSSLLNVQAVQFQRGLEEIGRIKNIKSVAFHENIGIQRGIGDWQRYLKIIQSFATQFQQIKTVVYTAKIANKIHT